MQTQAMSETGHMSQTYLSASQMDSYEHYVIQYSHLPSEIPNPASMILTKPQLETNINLLHHTTVKKKLRESKKSSGTQVVACSVCSKYFKSAHELNKHSVAHTNERPYVCTLCPKTFKHSSTLKNHTKKHNGQLNHVCQVCHKRFLKPSILKEHFRVHSGEKPYECSICAKSFAVQQYLTRHMTTHTGEKKYQCCYCPKKFTDNSSLRYHRRTHTGERPFTCNDCGETFISKLTADRHYQCKHSNSKPFACHLCGKRFKFKVYLNKHLLVHIGSRNFKCATCLRSFFTRANLKRHLLIHSAIKPYSCCLCDKEFRCWRSMIRHLAAHGNMHVWKCYNCDKRFQISKNLRKHYEVFCPKRDSLSLKYQTNTKYSQSLDGQIARNKLNQSKNGNYNCRVCGEYFRSLGTLYGKHMEMHKVFLKQQYACQYCSKGFWSKQHLAHHVPIHSDIGSLRHRFVSAKQKQFHVVTTSTDEDDPLYCRKCHLYFRRRSSFNFHMLIHSDQIFSCIFCSRKYIKYQILFEHTKRCHEEERKQAKIEMEIIEDARRYALQKHPKGGGGSRKSRAKRSSKHDPPYRSRQVDKKSAALDPLLNYPQRSRRSRKTLNSVVEKLKMTSGGKRQRT